MSYTKEDYKSAFVDFIDYTKHFLIMSGIILAIILGFASVMGALIYCTVHYFTYTLCMIAVIAICVRFWAILEASRSVREYEEECRVYPVSRQMDLFEDSSKD